MADGTTLPMARERPFIKWCYDAGTSVAFGAHGAESDAHGQLVQAVKDEVAGPAKLRARTRELRLREALQ